MVARSAQSIPEPIAKEWVSIAYVEAIAAQAGLNMKRSRWDDGYDLEIGSNKPMFGNNCFRNLYISFQLKATQNWAVRDDRISFSLSAAAHDRLASAAFPPHYFVLYTLPFSRSRWITHKQNWSEFRDCAYYVTLYHPSGTLTTTARTRGNFRTVHVPIQNRFTAPALLRLYRSACQETIAMQGVP